MTSDPNDGKGSRFSRSRLPYVDSCAPHCMRGVPGARFRGLLPGNVSEGVSHGLWSLRPSPSRTEQVPGYGQLVARRLHACLLARVLVQASVVDHAHAEVEAALVPDGRHARIRCSLRGTDAARRPDRRARWCRAGSGRLRDTRPSRTPRPGADRSPRPRSPSGRPLKRPNLASIASALESVSGESTRDDGCPEPNHRAESLHRSTTAVR